MRNTKAMAGFLALMAAGLMASGSGYREPYEAKESEESRKRRLELAKIERYKKQGLKEFKYGEVSIWALSKERADKKFKNLSK